MDADGDMVDYEKKEEYIADDKDNDLEYLRGTYGYDVSMMHIEEAFEYYSSIYNDEDITSNINSVAESTVLCSSLPTSLDWLVFWINQVNNYNIHSDLLAFDQVVRNYEAEIKFGVAIGSTSSHYSQAVYNDSPFQVPSLVDVVRNLYSTVEATVSKPKGVTVKHLYKV